MGFVFVSNTGRAGLPSRAAFYLEPGCLHQERPEECLEKLSFSLPVPTTKKPSKNHTSTTDRIGRTRNTIDGTERIRIQRHGTRRAGSGSRRRRRMRSFRKTGGPGKREEEAESREKMGRKRGQRLRRVRSCSASEKSFDRRRAVEVASEKRARSNGGTGQRRTMSGDEDTNCGWPARRA